jgi:TRAP-type uncharacterized transport system fused permease subunit
MLPTYLAMLIGCYVPLVFLLFPFKANSSRDKIPFYDLLLFFAAIPLPVYLVVNWEKILYSGWAFQVPLAGFLFGILEWIALFEAARRVVGLVLAALVGVFSIYPLFAIHCPGFLLGRQISLQRLVSYQFIGDSGVTGILMSVVHTELNRSSVLRAVRGDMMR